MKAGIVATNGLSSAVWGKRELVCPNVENENIVSTYEGGTNLFWAERLGQQLGLDDLWV